MIIQNKMNEKISDNQWIFVAFGTIFRLYLKALCDET